MLPIPAVQGGAVENLTDFYLEYNDKHHLHDITIYSPWNPKVSNHPALSSNANHYIYIDVTSLKARIFTITNITITLLNIILRKFSLTLKGKSLTILS